MKRRELHQLIKEAVEDAIQQSSFLKEGEIEKELQDLAQDIAKGIEDKKDELGESAVVLTISTIFAIPGIIEGVGNILKLVSKLVGSKKGENLSDKIVHTGHKVEKYFTKPIAWAIKKAMPKLGEEEANKWSQRIHKSIIMLLLLASGKGFIDAVKEVALDKATAEGVLAAIKGTELAKFALAKG